MADRPVREALRSAGTDDLLNQELYTDISAYLADDILVKVDRHEHGHVTGDQARWPRSGFLGAD